MTLNELLIDAFVVFFCLHGPFEGSSFTKLLLAGEYKSQAFEVKRRSNSFHSKEKVSGGQGKFCHRTLTWTSGLKFFSLR